MGRTRIRDVRTDGRTDSQNGTYVSFPLIFLAIFSHTRLKKRHTSKNGMNRIKENLLLPIVLQVTQVPLGSYGQMDGLTEVSKSRIVTTPFNCYDTKVTEIKFGYEKFQ
jgi:hypothetical protein